MQFIPFMFAAAFPVCLLWAAGNDIATMTIPNRLNIILAAFFLPAALLAGMPMLDLSVPFFDLTRHSDLLSHFALGFVGLILGIVLLFLNLMGGGDAKLLAAMSLWLGFPGWIAMLVYTAVAGGALSLILILGRRFFSSMAPVLPHWLGQHLQPKGKVPYGIAICVGGLMAIPHSDLWEKLALPFAG